MKPAGKSATPGFTLLELIIAFTIMALMAGIVFSSLRMAMNAYEKSQVRIEEEATLRVLFDQIKRQIGSLYPLNPTGGFVLPRDPMQQTADPVSQMAMSQMPLFWGAPDFVTFISVAPLVLHENPGLTVVRYGLAQDEYGDFYLGSMETRYTGQESFEIMAHSPIGKPLPIVRGIQQLEFQYYGFDPGTSTYGWYQAWLGSEMGSVPEAVRINFNNEYLIVPVNAVGAGGGNLIGRVRSARGVFGE